MGLVSLLFSFRGRINRAQYWAGTLGTSGVTTVFVMVMGMPSLIAFEQPNPKAAFSMALGRIGLMLLVQCVATWCSLAIQVKRFHDRGRTGWLSVIPIILTFWVISALFGAAIDRLPLEKFIAALQGPFTLLMLVSLAFLIDLGCLGSVPYPNKHGDPPGSPGYDETFGPLPPRPTPNNNAEAAGALFGAQAAIERAIAERPKAPSTPPTRLHPSAAPAAPRAPAGATSSFGRRPAS